MKNKFSSLLDQSVSQFEHLNEESLLIKGGAGAASNGSYSNNQCDHTKVCCTPPPSKGDKEL